MRPTTLTLVLLAVSPWPSLAIDSPRFVAQEIDPHVGNVCYAVTAADVDGDGKLDVVAVSEDAVVWYREPELAAARHHPGRDREGQRLHPAPRHRRRRPDRLRPRRRLAAARHRPGQHAPVAGPRQGGQAGRSTRSGSTSRRSTACGGATSRERARSSSWWPRSRAAARRDRTGAKGRGSGSWSTTSPPTPRRTAWPVEVADQSLHTIHNLQLVDLDGDHRDEIVLACWEGVFRPGPRRRRQVDPDPAGHGQPGVELRSREPAR